MSRTEKKSDPAREKSTGSVSAERDSRNDRARDERQRKHFPFLCLAALGVVYGDIGTSPIYAVRQCFSSEHAAAGLTSSPLDVLGILSLIFWALMIVVSLKYLLYVMRADNHGEGGILALLALLRRKDASRSQPALVALGLFGAALLYGDGMITPAISVLSAMEGLKIATPNLEHYVVPVTIAILIVLFLYQHKGTGGLGKVFGPVTLLWFVVIALLGAVAIARYPAVLAAVNPSHAFIFFAHHGWAGFGILGAVFLVATGAEALYADMGHFGRRAIRLTWFALVLPALLLNYFGQGALLLRFPDQIAHPFFQLAPDWALYPLVFLATAATIIASQAVISGAFSLTRQAVLLDDFPQVQIVHTSAEEIGQVYVPSINWLLMICTVGLVLGFRSSERLAGAYGLAVTSTMVITTTLIFFVARTLWKWNPVTVWLLTSVFLFVDLAFFSANLLKFISGGWFPLLVAAVMYLVMSTWKGGRGIARRATNKFELSVDEFLKEIAAKPPTRTPGVSVFLTHQIEGVPRLLLHYLKRTQSLSETILLLTVETQEIPHIPVAERIEIAKLSKGFYRIILNYGFRDSANIPAALKCCTQPELNVDPDEITYYTERPDFIATGRSSKMTRWRKKLFAFLTRNSTQPIAFFHIPPPSVVELGLELEI